MCLAKPLLKTIMTIMAIASIAGGVAVMIFGGVSLNKGAFSYLNQKWIMYTFVYGFGAFLIVVGLLQFWACSGENRCAIFSYEIFAIAIFLIFGGFLIGVWWFKSDILRQVEKEMGNDKGDLQRMFYGVQEHNDTIFTEICKNAHIVPDCSHEDLIEIYETDKNIPNSFWFNVGAMMEGVLECSGLNETLTRYYFTTNREDKPISGCQKRFTQFIETSFSSFTTIGAISIVVLIMLFLDVMAGCCLCCHPERTDSKQYASPYSPM